MTDSTLDDDLTAEGEPEREFNPGIAERLPRKTTAGGALIRNAAGHILFLEPIYKPTLEIPGGVAEHNESPRDACLREVTEETGLTVTLDDAAARLRPSMARRLASAQSALDAGIPAYAQFGRPRQ